MPAAQTSIEIRMLPAGHGDALLVRYRNGDRVGRLLIDGGPTASYRDVLAGILALPREERAFEALVVTHIDSDHIDGIIRLLQEDLAGLGISFGDVWFNGAKQLDQVLAAEDTLGAVHGEYLQALIDHLGLPWNEAFGGGPILGRPHETVRLPAGAKVRVLGPSRDRLLALLHDWQKTVADAEYTTGDTPTLLKRLKESRLRPLGVGSGALDEEPDDTLGGGGQREQGPDDTPANGSSIVFVLEVGRKKVLFTGDAHTQALRDGLDAALEGGARLKLDAVKMPHHGSRGNWSADLLDRIDCRDFLFSSNGKHYDHPHVEPILTLIEGVATPRLWFNYATKQTTVWLKHDADGKAIVHLPSGIAFR